MVTTMRHYVIGILLFISVGLHAQGVWPYQINGNLPKTTLWVLGTDTVPLSPKYGLGKWYNAAGLIGALGDRDWTKLDGSIPPIATDSIKRSGYTKWDGIEQTEAVQIEVLKEGILEYDGGIGLAGRIFSKVRPLQQNQSNVDFNFSVESSNAGHVARNNDIMWMGWNMSPGGVRTSGSGTAFGISFENHYATSATTLYNEFHLVFIDSSGTTVKPITFFLDKGDYNSWLGAFHVPTFEMRPPLSNDPYFLINTAGTQSLMRFLAPSTTNGVEFYIDPTNSQLTISNYGMTNPSSLSCDTYTKAVFNKLYRVTSTGNTAVSVAGNDSDGGFTNVTIGPGLDLNSGSLDVDVTEFTATHSFYEVGTTVNPNHIDDAMFHGAGNVGIGSSSPGNRLTIASASDDAIPTLGTNSGKVGIFRNSGIGSADLYGMIMGQLGTGDFYQQVQRVDGSAQAYNLLLQPSGGSVGIGLNTSPSKPLHVLGEARITGSGGTATTITGRDAEEDLTDVGTGWGIDLTSGNLIVDSSEVATQYDLTTIGDTDDQDLANASDATSHTVSIEDGDGTFKVAEGTGITLTTSGTAQDGIVTIATTVVDTDTDDQTLSYNTSTDVLTISEGNSVDLSELMPEIQESGAGEVTDATHFNFLQGLDNAADGTGGAISIDISEYSTDGTIEEDELLFAYDPSGTNHELIDVNSLPYLTAEVDGSTTNELQTLSGTGTASAYTVTLSNSGGSLKLNEGGGIEFITPVNGLNSEITIEAVDQDETNELQTISASGTTTTYGINLSDGGGTVNLVEGTGVTIDRTGNDLTINSSGGSDHDWYEEGTTTPPNAITDNMFTQAAEVGIGTTTPDFQLDIESNTANVMINDLNGGSGNQLIIRTDVSADGTDVFGGISFQYTDASSVDAWDIEAFRRENDVNNSTLYIRANENTDADVFVSEKNVNFSANTTESHNAFNAGLAFTQTADISTSGDLELDRSYHTINITGGVAGDTIKLPEVASTSDNWDPALTATQCQVGQIYVITNFKTGGVNLVVAAFNPSSGNSDLINSQTNITTNSFINLAPNSSVTLRCVRLASGVGYWYTY